jgi:hypothetical protein
MALLFWIETRWGVIVRETFSGCHVARGGKLELGNTRWRYFSHSPGSML